MEYTSGLFARQASSDLAMAQELAKQAGCAIALASEGRGAALGGLEPAQVEELARRSGYCLGAALCLAQQSMEKQLKSIVLKLSEILGLGFDEKFYRKDLGHIIYSHPREFYLSCLKRLGFPTDLGDRGALDSASPGFGDLLARRVGYLGGLGASWGKKFYTPRVQSLLLLYYLAIPLSRGELEELNTYVFGTLDRIDGDEPTEPLPHRFANRRPETGMIHVVLDGQRLQQHRDAHSSHPHHVAGRLSRKHLFVKGTLGMRRAFKHASTEPRAAIESSTGMDILEYGLLTLLAFSAKYLYMAPHFTFSRYPSRLCNGMTAAEACRSGHNAVLAGLFIDAQYTHDQLCRSSRRLDYMHEARRRGGF